VRNPEITNPGFLQSDSGSNLASRNFILEKQPIIRKIVASLLLVLFIMSSLPKAYFHDLVADHVDVVSCDQKHSEAVLHKQSVNCHFDDLVVTSHFVASPAPDFEIANFHFEKKVFVSFDSYQYSFVQHKEGRGPPAVPAT
jgi:hypothetical protein